MTEATKLSASPHSSWLLWHFTEEWMWLSLCNSKRIFLDAEVFHQHFYLHKDVQSLPGGFLAGEVLQETLNLSLVSLPDTL